MSNSNHQEPSIEPDDRHLPEEESILDKPDVPADSPSEVAKRLSLLGKLIIPPPAP